MTPRAVRSATPLSEREIFLWGCLGFVLPYLAWFIVPTFFSRRVMFHPEAVPTMDPIATDLHNMMGWGRDWLDPSVPYHGYPPLSNVLFAVMYQLPFTVTYAVLTATTLALFLLLLLGLPLHCTRPRKVSPLLALFLVTGLLSYGLQFEIERGQFNVLAFGLGACGVWLFHAKPRWALLAYALFCAGIQLKLYPAILGLLLTHDYRDINGNLRRAGRLAAVNIILLFALGPQRFLEFMSAIGAVASGFAGWSLNHSIDSFVTFADITLSRHIALPAYASAVAHWTLTLSSLACLGAIFGLNYRDRQTGLDPYLLLACTISALLIPPVSLDYKLSILVAPTALAVIEFAQRAAVPSHPRGPGIAALFLMIAAYATTLFTYELKPTVLDNNCVALFVMLGCVTAMAAMRSVASASSSAVPAWQS